MYCTCQPNNDYNFNQINIIYAYDLFRKLAEVSIPFLEVPTFTSIFCPLTGSEHCYTCHIKIPFFFPQNQYLLNIITIYYTALFNRLQKKLNRFRFFFYHTIFNWNMIGSSPRQRQTRCNFHTAKNCLFYLTTNDQPSHRFGVLK